MEEGAGQLIDEGTLFLGKGIGIVGVYSGEVGILHGISGAIDGDALILIVDLVQQQPVRHTKAGVAQQLLPLQLEENDGNGLVHSGGQQLILFRVVGGVFVGQLHLKTVDVAVLVYLVGKDRQRPQRDAVARLDDFQIVVAQRVGQYGGHQGAGAGGGPHPQHVVVAPLDIHAVVVHQRVQNDVRPRTTVKDIAHQMKMVHRQSLDELAQLHQEVGGPVDVDDGGNDILVIVPLVHVLIVSMDHFINDVGVLRRHSLTDLGTGVFGADQTAHLDQAVEGDPVPLPHIGRLPLNLLQFFLGIVDKGGQLVQIGLGYGGGKQAVQLLAYHAGSRVQDVKEGLILAVYVGDKVLSAFGQVLNGVEVDDLGAGSLDIWVLPGQHFQIVQVFRTVCFLTFHGRASFWMSLPILSHFMWLVASRIQPLLDLTV